ncbi:uncharacterized protein G2W53_025587 [Senna tora]|uniref:Uncharacterized protein n=1 Tax=Senna tora TaxID=362788 RepID=A0A834WEX2_9FABA|nr:uncharacterized protein G2W53_025587 [Senna tora]
MLAAYCCGMGELGAKVGYGGVEVVAIEGYPIQIQRGGPSSFNPTQRGLR